MGEPTSVRPTPLRNSYWVLPGKVLAGEHPGGSSRDSTRERLQRLMDAGVECFIDLTEPNELKPYDGELPFSVEYLRKPIKDHGTPSQRMHMAEILDCIHDALQSGRCVYVHCRAGIGRTGTVVGCFLVERGLPGEAALDELNRLWQQCERSHNWSSIPETSDQTNYVVRWKRRGIFDDRGGLTTPDLVSPEDEDELRSSGSSAPWAHLLGHGPASPSSPRPLSNASTPSGARDAAKEGSSAAGSRAGAVSSSSAPSPRSSLSPTATPSSDALSSRTSQPLAAGTSRAAVANAARTAARESDGQELLTDPTSVAKLPQPGKSRPGVPGWISSNAPALGATSSNATPGTAQPPIGARMTATGSSRIGRSGANDVAANIERQPAADGSVSRTPGGTGAGPSAANSPASPGDQAGRGAPQSSAPRAAELRAAAELRTSAHDSVASNTSTPRPAATSLGAAAESSPTKREPTSTPRDDANAGSSAPVHARPGDSGVFQAVVRDADTDPLSDPEALAAANNLRDRFLGALVGLAVGDAVAAVTQYRRPGSFTPVGDMLGGGPFDLPRGGWSDDTAMTLCLADSLLERNGFDARDQMERYRRWQQQGYLSATGQCVGITASTARAIAMAQWRRQAFSGSHDPSQQDPEPLSRVAAAVLFFFATSGEAVNQATEAARTTCQAPAVLDACRALARALYAALTGQPKAVVLEKAALAIAASTSVAATASADGASAAEPGAVVAQRVGVTAPVALAAAVAAFGATDNFRDAILYAVNLGGDSDVVAAVCGQLAGAYYSVKAIPTSWYNGLMQKELINSYADRLLAHALVGLSG